MKEEASSFKVHSKSNVKFVCQPSGGCVGHNVPANGLLGIRGEHGGTVHLGHDLVRDHNCHSKLGRKREGRRERLYISSRLSN